MLQTATEAVHGRAGEEEVQPVSKVDASSHAIVRSTRNGEYLLKSNSCPQSPQQQHQFHNHSGSELHPPTHPTSMILLLDKTELGPLTVERQVQTQRLEAW